MSIKDWKYYNHAVISNLEPHEVPDLSCIKDKSIWKVDGVFQSSQDGQQIMIADMKPDGGML